jgi:hypothetical protein
MRSSESTSQISLPAGRRLPEPVRRFVRPLGIGIAPVEEGERAVGEIAGMFVGNAVAGRADDQVESFRNAWVIGVGSGERQGAGAEPVDAGGNGRKHFPLDSGGLPIRIR